MCREEILTATSANLTGNKLHRASKEQGGRTSSPDVEAAQRYTVFYVPKKLRPFLQKIYHPKTWADL